MALGDQYYFNCAIFCVILPVRKIVMKKKLSCFTGVLALTFVLSACTKNDDLDTAEIKNILIATQTKESERTIEWYEKNDFVRNDIIERCMALVENKIAEKNAVGAEYKLESIEKQVNKNTDCLNARQANINIEARLDKSRITYDEYNRRLRSYEAANSNAHKLTTEEIEELKSQMNNTLEDMDDNQIGRAGSEDFEKLKQLIQTEVETDTAKPTQ